MNVIRLDSSPAQAFSVILVLGVAELLSACAPYAAERIRLQSFSYVGPASESSNRNATLRVVVGEVTGGGSGTTIAIGGAFVPIASPSVPKVDFNSEDELMLAEVFRDTLVNNHLFKDVEVLPLAAASDSAARSPMPVDMTLTFTSTNRFNVTIVLDVNFEIKGGKAFTRSYHVLSDEGDTVWQTMNTNLVQGKQKAAKKLLNKLMPDVEAWIRENPQPTEPVKH